MCFQYVPLTECLSSYQKKSFNKLQLYVSTVKLCTYFITLPMERLNLDPTGISKFIRKQQINKS